MKKAHAYLQTIIKAPVNLQQDQPKTVGGVARTRYLLPIGTDGHTLVIHTYTRNGVKLNALPLFCK